MSDGNLLCVAQCGDLYEPAPGNRVFAFLSRDEGETWEKLRQIYPETGEAVYCTEVFIRDGTIRAFLQIHNGCFLNMRCEIVESTDNGLSWTVAGPSPCHRRFCFHRGTIPLVNGEHAMPYMRFPLSEAENARLIIASHNLPPRKQKRMMDADIDHVATGVLTSSDGGKTFEDHVGPNIAIKGDTGRNWVWAEPTLAQLSDGRLVMFLRVDHTGVLWRSESRDNGRTWTDAERTDIPNPGNKPKLIPMPDGRIALIHTPSSSKRFPLALWISDDDLRSFSDQRTITDFPGRYCYPDGFHEEGHILFTIESNRREILFFDCEL